MVFFRIQCKGTGFPLCLPLKPGADLDDRIKNALMDAFSTDYVSKVFHYKWLIETDVVLYALYEGHE